MAERAESYDLPSQGFFFFPSSHFCLNGLSNSVLTLYGMNFSSDFEFIQAQVFGFGSLTAYLSPNFALKSSFKLRFSPELKRELK